MLKFASITAQRCAVVSAQRALFSTSGRGAALLKQLAAAKGPAARAAESFVTPSGSNSDAAGVLTAACGDVEEDVTEMEDMFVATPVGLEWGGKR